MATIQQQDAIIIDLIKLALELGANPLYVNKLILINGMSLQEATYRGYIEQGVK